MSFFGFGAFSTPVGQLIERATDNAASAGNLALHLEICDQINDTDNGPKDAVVAMRKRFTGNTKNFHIINLTLTVLETAVKNCGLRLHVKVAQKDFLNDLTRVINPKNNPPTIVRERVLGLIQYWADAFKGKPQLQAVSELYEQLKAEGMEFPPVDLDLMAPVDTPERSVPARPQQPQLQLTGQPQAPPPDPTQSRGRGHGGPLKPEQVAKMLSELDVVRRNIDIMNEIMIENEPGKETEDDMQLLEDLNRSLHAMQSRVSGIIGRVTDEIVLESTLQINDELNSVFVRFDRYLRNREAAQSGSTAQPGAPTTATGEVATTSLIEPPNAPSISYPSLDSEQPPTYEDSAVGTLIDLGSDIQQPTQQPPPSGDIVAQLAELGITSEPAAQPAAQPKQQTEDEFDMFAQSRTAYSSQSGSTYDDNKQQQDTSIAARIHGRSPDQPQEQQEHTYANLAQWLAETDLEQPSTQGPPTTGASATSAEFDQFLAQRAEKGDSLPASRRPQMQKADDQSDDLFAL